MKFFYTYFFIIISVLIITTYITFKSFNNNLSNSTTMQKNISSKIIRLHVIGHSNTSYDQTIKLKVKHTIVKELQPLLKNVTSKTHANKIIKTHLTTLNKHANNTLKKYAVDYSANTSLSTVYFPIKQYGDLTLPEGNYESVCIKLGSAKGKNWWCVLYPTLCFVDCSHGVLPKESKTKLKTSLTLSEYNHVINQPSTKVTYQFAISKFLKNLIAISK